MPQLIGKIHRLEGAAVLVDIRDDLDVAEMAAIMESLSDYCKARGWHPGEIARAHADVIMARQGLRKANGGSRRAKGSPL